MRVRVCGLVLGLLIGFGLPVKAEDGYGTVTGQFVLQGEIPQLKPLVAKGAKNVVFAALCCKQAIPDESLLVDPQTKGISNVFVYLRKKPTQIPPKLTAPPKNQILIESKDCRFSPHASVIRAGQKVLIANHDSRAITFHSRPLNNLGLNNLVKEKTPEGIDVSRGFQVGELAPFPTTSDIHPWMKTWTLVVDHPYAVLTDGKGNFKIENLPAGEHEFRVWHERVGFLNKSLQATVKAGEKTDLGTLRVEVEKFKLD